LIIATFVADADHLVSCFGGRRRAAEGPNVKEPVSEADNKAVARDSVAADIAADVG
jgi:hypothetical protein